MLFPAEAPSCGSEFWRWQESAAGGGQPASWPAGVSAELCGRFYNRCLPNSAVSLRNRVGKLCEEHRWKVHTPFVLQGVDHLFVLTELFLNLSPFNTGTEKAFESSQSLKSVWLPSMLPVKNTAIPQAQTQVADQTKKTHKSFYIYLFSYTFPWIALFLFCVLDSVPKVTPRIPSASLSQSVAVDETVLPAASQDITAYAANTETSQRFRQALTDTMMSPSKTLP